MEETGKELAEKVAVAKKARELMRELREGKSSSFRPAIVKRNEPKE